MSLEQRITDFVNACEVGEPIQTRNALLELLMVSATTANRLDIVMMYYGWGYEIVFDEVLQIICTMQDNTLFNYFKNNANPLEKQRIINRFNQINGTNIPVM